VIDYHEPFYKTASLFLLLCLFISSIVIIAKLKISPNDTLIEVIKVGKENAKSHQEIIKSIESLSLEVNRVETRQKVYLGTEKQ